MHSFLSFAIFWNPFAGRIYVSGHLGLGLDVIIPRPSSSQPVTDKKTSEGTILEFRAIIEELLGFFNFYGDIQPEETPTRYFATLDSLLHLITDVESSLEGVRMTIEDERLIHNQVLSK